MKDRRRLGRKFRVFIALSLFVLVLELAGGIFTNSLALLSDSGHVLFDILALGLAYFSIRLSARSASMKYTYGYFRAEIFSAIVNGMLLVLVSGLIFYGAYRRLTEPQEVKAPLMLAISVLGLLANLYVVFAMHGYEKENLNVRGAYLHVLGDTLTSIGVVAGAAVIMATGLTIIDPIISVIIGIIILAGCIRLIRESIRILMEAVPRDVDLEAMMADIRSVKGVEGVHDLHVWSISSDIRAASGHVIIGQPEMGSVNQIIGDINRVLKDRHRIDHSVIQAECERCADVPAEEEPMECKGKGSKRDLTHVH